MQKGYKAVCSEGGEHYEAWFKTVETDEDKLWKMGNLLADYWECSCHGVENLEDEYKGRQYLKECFDADAYFDKIKGRCAA